MSELAVRTLSGVVMIAVALAAAAKGGNVFAVAVALAAVAIYYEWTRIVRGWGVGWNVSGFIYALLPALALLWVRERDASGLYLLLWVFIVTWSTDIGAYFVGRAIGKRKLAPAISPGKTWEGAAGGLIGAAAYAMILSLFLAGAQATRMAAFLGAAALLVAVSIVGDLFESAAKRQAGVKDSGAILPGHGGLLDRIDSATAILPVAALMVLLKVIA